MSSWAQLNNLATAVGAPSSKLARVIWIVTTRRAGDRSKVRGSLWVDRVTKLIGKVFRTGDADKGMVGVPLW